MKNITILKSLLVVICIILFNPLFSQTCLPTEALIKGVVYEDLDQSCTKNAGENAIQGKELVFQPGNILVTTDADGKYSACLFPNNYALSIVGNSVADTSWETSCPVDQVVMVNLSGLDNDSLVNFDLGLRSFSPDCPRLRCDVIGGTLKPCKQSLYVMKYQNVSTVPAFDAHMVVTMDDLITIDSSSYPWSLPQTGQNYLFEFGTLMPGDSGVLTLNVTLDCDALAGETHCVNTHIMPDSNCLPNNPLWSGADVWVGGNCKNDSLACFWIRNTGGGDMTTPSLWRLFENTLLVQNGAFQLTAGDSMQICYNARGNAIHLAADQVDYFPRKSLPQAYIEGCGAGTSFVPNMLGQFAMDEEDISWAKDCNPNIGSNPPSTLKFSGSPSGTGEPDWTESTDEVDFRIGVTNTTGDSVGKIVIRDTLSEFLNPMSIISGSASHDYKLYLGDNGAIEIVFEDVNLPDYSIDELKSQLFVNFRVHQVPDNPPGTVILSKVSVSLDSALSMTSNEEMNTIKGDYYSTVNYDTVGVCQGEYYYVGGANQYNSGMYQDEFTSSQNMDSVVLTQLNVNSVPSAPVIVQSNDTLFLQAANWDSIQWMYYNNILPNSNQDWFDTNLPGIYSAQYWVNGCGSASTTHVILVGMEDDLEGIFDVFPNPGKGLITVIHPEGIDGQLELVDINGRVVFSTSVNFNSDKTSLDLEGIASGIYLTKISAKEKVYLKKLIVE